MGVPYGGGGGTALDWIVLYIERANHSPGDW